MSRWFRFYNDANRNPKVAKLSDRQFRLWVDLLCLASENDGLIPPLDDVKHLLNRRLDYLSTGVEALIRVGLIDCYRDCYTPHNWNKFQYKSDSSTKRVQKHRAGCNVSVTAPETETDTEADTDHYPNQEERSQGNRDTHEEFSHGPFSVLNGGKS